MSGMIKHFCELTGALIILHELFSQGCDAYTAKSFLDANDGNLQMAVDLFYASNTPRTSPPEPPTPQLVVSHEGMSYEIISDPWFSCMSTSCVISRVLDLWVATTGFGG